MPRQLRYDGFDLATYWLRGFPVLVLVADLFSRDEPARILIGVLVKLRHGRNGNNGVAEVAWDFGPGRIIIG